MIGAATHASVEPMSTDTTERTIYDLDFVEWTQRQAELLRSEAELRSNAPLDWLNLAEEIESLGLRDRREVGSRLETIAVHLLKLRLSPAVLPERGWRETVSRERRELELVLDDSPSLRRDALDLLQRRWRRARRDVVDALADEVEENDIPTDCPFSPDQLLDPDFWPPRERVP